MFENTRYKVKNNNKIWGEPQNMDTIGLYEDKNNDYLEPVYWENYQAQRQAATNNEEIRQAWFQYLNLYFGADYYLHEERTEEETTVQT